MEQGSHSDAQTGNGQALRTRLAKESLAGIRRAPDFEDWSLPGAIVSCIESGTLLDFKPTRIADHAAKGFLMGH